MAEQATAVPASPLAVLARLSARQKLTALVLVALAIAVLVGTWLWSREPPYGVLFSNLSDQDGGQIIAALQQQNIPYKYSEGGSAILVPAAKVHDARLKLASQGLPKGGLVGFELMENQKLGTSQFAEQVNYQRGLEGELARSIQTLAVVRAARVHLAIPKQTAFLRDELKPSASVLVSLQPGRALDPAQIAGIVHLVSSSVPQLAPASVSVIDQNGKLLAPQRNGAAPGELDAGQLGYLREVEATYVRRIETILQPVLGKDNFRTQVAAEIDFNQIDQVEESYLPNPAPDAAIRSQQTSESGTGAPAAAGVPGALTNQPPVPATAPLTAPPVAAVSAGAGGNYTRNATINYELDKTIRHTRATPGGVKRLSIAVAVNHKRPLDASGKPGKPVPPSSEELKRIGDLVREAVGFNEKRGDTINIAAASFVPDETVTALVEPPPWKDATTLALAREVAQYLLLLLVAWLVWAKLLRPVVEMLRDAASTQAAARGQAAETMAEARETAQGTPEPDFEAQLQAARDIARREPKLVANLIKEWMSAGRA